MDYKKIAKESNYARKEILLDQKDLNNVFENKSKIEKKYDLFDISNLDYNLTNQLITLNGIGTLSKEKIDDKECLCLSTNTKIENIKPRPSSSISFKFDHLDLSEYNYLNAQIYVEATGYEGFYFHFMTGNTGHYTNHAPIVYPNVWMNIDWNCSHIVRDDICLFSITPFLMGCPPEALPDIKVYIKSISALKKDNIYDEGWELENRIAFSHCGYKVLSTKHAVVSHTVTKTFKVCNDSDTFTFDTKECNSNLGSFTLLDFSSLENEGIYHIEIDDIKSEDFIISDECFNSSILKSMNFLRMLRCGEHIPGVHTKCHLNCKSVHPDGRTVPNHGGWHDAGDVSQFEICTAEIATSLLDIYGKFDEELNERILEEAMVGLDWLLQTRFGDGYRAMAVTYSIWRDNVLSPDNETIKTNLAERGSFENFLSSISLLRGYEVFKERDPLYANYLLRCGLEDLDFAYDEFINDIYTVRWGKPITSQTCGCGLITLSLAYKFTNNNKYLDIIEDFVNKVVTTQETNKDVPLYGFYYEDVDHKYLLHYEHRGHEEYPVWGLISAYNLLEESPLKDKIYQSLKLYINYIKESIKYSQPYGLLPASICNIDKVNYEHFTLPRNYDKEKMYNNFKAQIESGVHLKDNWYLRLNPISDTRRGFLATLLSKTKAVSALSKLFNDQELKDISQRQIEWTIGFNPFSSSLMYGEGYNNHKLYVAFSKQIVGSLPVGIKTLGSHDLPYWPDYTNAVFKEIWGHTTAKYLEVLADLL